MLFLYKERYMLGITLKYRHVLYISSTYVDAVEITLKFRYTLNIYMYICVCKCSMNHLEV